MSSWHFSCMFFIFLVFCFYVMVSDFVIFVGFMSACVCVSVHGFLLFVVFWFVYLHVCLRRENKDCSTMCGPVGRIRAETGKGKPDQNILHKIYFPISFASVHLLCVFICMHKYINITFWVCFGYVLWFQLFLE